MLSAKNALPVQARIRPTRRGIEGGMESADFRDRPTIEARSARVRDVFWTAMKWEFRRWTRELPLGARAGRSIPTQFLIADAVCGTIGLGALRWHCPNDSS